MRRLLEDGAAPNPPQRSPIRLASLCAAICAALVAGTVETQNAIANGDTRTLSLVHQHTGESASITFKRDGRYDRAALDQLNWLLRDWRQNESTKMDPRLFDVVWEAQRSIGSSQPLRIVCGYRSPKTNGMLRARSSGVAEHSQHMLGKAMDFFMTDATVDDLRAAGVRLQRGGVGWYPRSGSPFVHLDVGSVRAWPRMTRDQLARIFPDGKTVHLPVDGKPLARYEEARAEILARGGTVLGYTAIAQTDPIEDGPGLKGFFAGLFGGPSNNTLAPVPAATPGKARGKSTIAIASADPEDATGAKQALAYAAPASSEALRDAMLKRDGLDALSGTSPPAAAPGKTAPGPWASTPLPPRRPAEFAAITAALNLPMTRAAEIRVASLDNTPLHELAHFGGRHAFAPARLIPATADAREQLRALFDSAVRGASEPASDTVPVHVALARAKPIEMADDLFSRTAQVPPARFSLRRPGDDLAASRFSGSATGAVAGLLP